MKQNGGYNAIINRVQPQPSPFQGENVGQIYQTWNFGKINFMQKMPFSIEIKASREKVWNTLWEDKTFRDWASIIDEGTYMVGEMKEGNELQFISSESGYGVTSLIEKLALNESVLFRHMRDTKESGEQEREKEWTGGTESYSLAEKDGITTLLVELHVPRGQVEMSKVRFPKALKRVKILAEK